MDAWDNLDAAEKAGHMFRSQLSKTEGFGLTKWFGGISRFTKPAVLAIAVASGATGCSSLSKQALDHQQTPYQAMSAEAQTMDRMAPHELRRLIEDRDQTEAFDGLERTTVTELATRIAEKRMGKVDFDTEMALENPYVPGQLVQVSQNNDFSANFTIAFTGGYGIRHAIDTYSKNSPHALNGNLVAGKVGSFEDPGQPGFIVLPDSMNGTWSDEFVDEEAQNIAFTLYHELAHLHMTQEMALHLDQGVDQNLVEAFYKTYKIFNESHSDLSGALSVNKAYDLDPDDFIRKLENMQALNDFSTMNAGMNGSPEESFGLGMYRPQKAFDVIIEITKNDPSFLKSLEDQEIPLMAYEIMRKAGYYHNAAELILENGMSSIDPELSEVNGWQENAFASNLKSTFPDNERIDQSASALEDAWKDLFTRDTLSAYHSDLSASIMFRDTYLPEQAEENARRAATLNPVEESYIPALINPHIDAVKTESNPEKLFSHLAGLKNAVKAELNGMPDRDDIQEDRMNALADIRQELTEMDERARSNDKSSVVAGGSGQSTADIADVLMERYGINATVVADHVASQQSAGETPAL